MYIYIYIYDIHLISTSHALSYRPSPEAQGAADAVGLVPPVATAPWRRSVALVAGAARADGVLRNALGSALERQGRWELRHGGWSKGESNEFKGC